MGQVGRYLRRVDGGWAHWCPGCESMHRFPTDRPLENGSHWNFDGNIERPTFTPSMNIGDDWCHYHLINGELRYTTCHGHNLGGLTFLLPELPPGCED